MGNVTVDRWRLRQPTVVCVPTIIVSNTTLKVDDKVYSFDDKESQPKCNLPQISLFRHDFWNWY